MKYNTFEEAKKAADFENMGRDYGTAIVVDNGGVYSIKIV